MANGEPRSNDTNGWILWRLERVEKTLEQISDLGVLREKVTAMEARMNALDSRAQSVSRALWGLTGAIIVGLVLFVVTGST